MIFSDFSKNLSQSNLIQYRDYAAFRVATAAVLLIDTFLTNKITAFSKYVIWYNFPRKSKNLGS